MVSSRPFICSLSSRIKKEDEADMQSNEVADIIVDDQPAPVEVVDDVPNVHDRMSSFQRRCMRNRPR